MEMRLDQKAEKDSLNRYGTFDDLYADDDL